MAPERDTGAAGSDGDGATPAFEAGLHAGGVTFETADANLLHAIDETGSLNAATDRLNRSYPRALERIDDLEDAFGPLVEATRGGADGGGSELTATARELLGRFARLRTEFAGVSEVAETVYAGTVVDRSGELAMIETPGGTLRALAPADSDAVHVTIRADTVTLHDPGEAPTGEEISARNRFEGAVAAIDEREAIALVSVDVGAEQPLPALITVESLTDLGLETGSAVVASFKTTATRATARD